MTTKLNIAIAQESPVVGDIAGNKKIVMERWKQAKAQGADMIVFPELFITGHTPENILFRVNFIKNVKKAINELATMTRNSKTAILIGAPWVEEDGSRYNAAVLLDKGEISHKIFKKYLPNKSVFNQSRLFKSAPCPLPVDFRGAKLGIMLCADMWYYDVSEHLASQGAELLVIINGSPYTINWKTSRINEARTRSEHTGLPVVFANMAGAHDGLLYDGASFAMDADGDIPVQLPQFKPSLIVTSWEKDEKKSIFKCVSKHDGTLYYGKKEIYIALMTGLREYIQQNNFPGVVLGMSGGMDSAFTAMLAADALGPENVHCVLLPSKYTSQSSIDDALKAAEMIGIKNITNIPINSAVDAFEGMLADTFRNMDKDVTEENIQPRVRGVTLMALSNKLGSLLLATGNKSETAVGYSTLYGDTCGGYAPIKDVYKTLLYELAEWRNNNKPTCALGQKAQLIPDSIMTKEPTAELRPNQKDTDSLPPYEEMDAILELMLEKRTDMFTISKEHGYDLDTVTDIWKRMKYNEFKRAQSPIGTKITTCTFGVECRYPITNRYEQ
ncbi:MAG: NAD+ synthase [Alphaproteobacteria bacterium]|nr:NAD+ synthase [Alphaproteobacteria bacterium]